MISPRNKSDSSNTMKEGHTFNTSGSSLLNFPVRVVVPTNLNKNNVTNINCLSEGSSATVFTGYFQGEQVVLKLSNDDGKVRDQHDGEVEVEHCVLERLCHPNIVQIQGAGYCKTKKFIVLEYLNGGSLYDLLEQKRSITIKPKKQKRSLFSLFNRSKVVPAPVLIIQEVVSIAKQIVQALEYLHESWHPNATIIHRDLKPQNIAISSTGVVKLIDFGLMTCVKKRTHVAETYQMTGFVGSLRYMAPEVVNHRPYNEKVDIYSFGIILWELATGKISFEGMTREAYIEKVVKGGLRPSLKGINPVMAKLISNCWNDNFLFRPTSSEILAKLEEMKNLQ